MNTVRKMLLTVVLVAFCGMYAAAQNGFNDNFNSLSRKEQSKWLKSYFGDVSRKEKKIRTKELMAYDVKDLMSGRSANLERTRRELMYYSDRMAAKGSRWMVGGYSLMVVAPMAGILVGVLSDATAAIFVGLGVGLAGGIMMVVKGSYDIMSAGELEKKSKLLVADAEVPLLRGSHLALGVSVFHSNIEQRDAFGPSVSLSF